MTGGITVKFAGTSFALSATAMPSSLHQGVVALLRDDPALAFDLLRRAFELELPALGVIRDRHGALDRFAPCLGDTGELRPDLVIGAEALDAEDPSGGAAVIIEVQRRVDPRKRWRIAVYAALLAERLARPTAVILVPLSDATARWARGLGAHELPPRRWLLVLDRQVMPRVVELSRARARPAEALLSALLHAVADDFEPCRVALQASLELADDRRWRYASTLMSAVPAAARESILGALSMAEREELTELERNSIAYHDGQQVGELAGRLAERAQLLLTVLELRGLALDAPAEARVHACEDLDQLTRWIERAKRVDVAAMIFRE